MAAGLQIWDASGNLVLDASHRVMRFIGMVQLQNGNSSSVFDSRMVSGGFISFQPDSYIGFLSGGLIHPQFSISSGTVSWTYAAKNSTTYDTYVNGFLYYGAY
jgi:hypothetical protein